MHFFVSIFPSNDFKIISGQINHINTKMRDRCTGMGKDRITAKVLKRI